MEFGAELLACPKPHGVHTSISAVVTKFVKLFVSAYRLVSLAIRSDPLSTRTDPLSALEELLGVMIQATGELFCYVEVWEAGNKVKLAASVYT
jgi:hypothetical protein